MHLEKSELFLAPLDYLFSFLRLVTMSLTFSGRDLIISMLLCHDGSGFMSDHNIFSIPSCKNILSKEPNCTFKRIEDEVVDTVLIP